jgi:hypothetical protein
MTGHITRAAIVLIAASAAATLAQQPAGGLQAVEPGSEDVGPLRISARMLPGDLRAPTAFERVYRVPGGVTGVAAVEGDRYARISGGLTAVFPHSQYLQTTKQTFALIPSGTVFYIGGLPERPATSPALPAANIAPTRVSTLLGGSSRVGPVDLRVRPEDQSESSFSRVQVRPDAPMPPDNVLVNDTYRRLRLRAMLMAAARVGGG